MQINGYGTNYVGASRASKDKNTVTINGQEVKVSDGNELGMDSFLNLLAAQLSNQDMNNPMDNTQFIAQLAQFSTLQAMTNMAKIQTLQQSTSLVGQKVIVADVKADADDYTLLKDTGYVEKVTIFNDEPQIYVNGKAYAFKNVMEVLNVPDIENVSEATVLLGKMVTMKVPVESDDKEDKEDKEGSEDTKPKYETVQGIVSGVFMNDKNELQLWVDGVAYDYNYVTKIEQAPDNDKTEEILNGIYDSIKSKEEPTDEGTDVVPPETGDGKDDEIPSDEPAAGDMPNNGGTTDTPDEGTKAPENGDGEQEAI